MDVMFTLLLAAVEWPRDAEGLAWRQGCRRSPPLRRLHVHLCAILVPPSRHLQVPLALGGLPLPQGPGRVHAPWAVVNHLLLRRNPVVKTGGGSCYECRTLARLPVSEKS
jgi:hypothetical protein